ncbi:polysaccharide lyase [Thalassospira profundimaris]|nr:polysaccharide lyase [Thalassospira profundimaris]
MAGKQGLWIVAALCVLAGAMGAKAGEVVSPTVQAASPDAVSRGNFGPFVRSLNDRAYGYQLVPDPAVSADGAGSGKPARIVEKFEVRPGDCGGDNAIDCGRDRERSELSERGGRNPAGSTYWYRWSLYIPTDFVDVSPTKVALGQFHQEGSHPAWMFEVDGAGYHLDDHVTGRKPRYHTLIKAGALRGRWHDIVVFARWSKDSSGILRVWADNDLKFDYQGPTMTAEKIYFKYGLYRSFVSRYQNANETDKVPAQTVYFTNVRRANSREGLEP